MVSRMTKTPGILAFGFTPLVVTASIRDWASMDLDARGEVSRYLNSRVSVYISSLGCPCHGQDLRLHALAPTADRVVEERDLLDAQTAVHSCSRKAAATGRRYWSRCGRGRRAASSGVPYVRKTSAASSL